MINYSLSYRNVKVADLDEDGQKQYDANGDVIRKTVQKAYATAQSIDTLTNDEFCKAVAAMGAYSKADIMSIVTVLAKSIVEQVKLGQRIYLGELGNFYPSLSSKGVEDANKFTPTAHIRKAYVGWVRPAEMRELDKVTYNLVATRVAETAISKANKSALASATLTQSDATQTAAENLELIRTMHQLTVSVASGMEAKGSVTGGDTYRHGSVVTVKAIPAAGYAFTKWSDGKRNAERVVTVNSAKTLTASFADDPLVKGTKLCNEDGSDLTAGVSVESIRLDITGNPPQTGALTLVKVGADGTETTVSGADYSPCESGYGCFDFSAPYLVEAGMYRVLKNDVMVLEWSI